MSQDEMFQRVLKGAWSPNRYRQEMGLPELPVYVGRHRAA